MSCPLSYRAKARRTDRLFAWHGSATDIPEVRKSDPVVIDTVSGKEPMTLGGECFDETSLDLGRANCMGRQCP